MSSTKLKPLELLRTFLKRWCQKDQQLPYFQLRIVRHQSELIQRGGRILREMNMPTPQEKSELHKPEVQTNKPKLGQLQQCLIAFFAFVAVAHAGNLVLPSARLIQGTTVVAHSSPLVAAPALAYSALPLPYAAHSSPIVSAYSSPLVSGLPVVSAHSASILSGVENTVVAGPSGTIVSGRSVGAPVVSAW
ncbi:hypothetical protein HUJ05_012774 [Dendroctonus ponderosae]|nr:hypothetical protein HUJ05_012774 [Dendroctonus ponderosae]